MSGREYESKVDYSRRVRQQEISQIDARLKAAFPHRAGDIDIAVVDTLLREKSSLILQDNPTLPLYDYYHRMVEPIQYHVPPASDSSAWSAAVNSDPVIAKQGLNVLIFLHTRTVLSALKPFYSGDADTNDELVQIGIMQAVELLRSVEPGERIRSELHRSIRSKVAGIIGEAEGVPAAYIKGGTYKEAISAIDAWASKTSISLSDKNALAPEVERLAKHLGVSRQFISDQIERRFLADAAGGPNPHDPYLASRQSIARDVLSRAMNYISEGDRVVIDAIFGVVGQEEMSTVSELAARFGVTEKRIKSKLGHGQTRLRHHQEVNDIQDLLQDEPESAVPLVGEKQERVDLVQRVQDIVREGNRERKAEEERINFIRQPIAVLDLPPRLTTILKNFGITTTGSLWNYNFNKLSLILGNDSLFVTSRLREFRRHLAAGTLEKFKEKYSQCT